MIKKLPALKRGEKAMLESAKGIVERTRTAKVCSCGSHIFGIDIQRLSKGECCFCQLAACLVDCCGQFAVGHGKCSVHQGCLTGECKAARLGLIIILGAADNRVKELGGFLEVDKIHITPRTEAFVGAAAALSDRLAVQRDIKGDGVAVISGGSAGNISIRNFTKYCFVRRESLARLIEIA